jgi:hypothetical protein
MLELQWCPRYLVNDIDYCPTCLVMSSYIFFAQFPTIFADAIQQLKFQLRKVEK